MTPRVLPRDRLCLAPFWSLWLLLALWSAGASAAPPADHDATERPWAVGVSFEKQRKALELFRQGNIALKEASYQTAADNYLLALAQWDHPAIHFNLALAYLKIAPPEQTYPHVVASLKYGRAPLDADKYDQAARYQALLEGQLSNIVIRCDTPAATVTLDGKTIFIAPGSFEALVRAGEHLLVVSKDGYVTTEQRVVLKAGQTATYPLSLFTTDQLTEYRRPLPLAAPWVVVSVGTALIGGSIALHFSARDAYRRYDLGIVACLDATTGGCWPNLQLSQQRGAADASQRAAIAGYVVGGLVAAAGAGLLYFNRLQAYRTSTKVAATVLPLILPSGGSASVMVTF